MSVQYPPLALCLPSFSLYLFFFTDTPTAEIYTLSLHDALPIWRASATGWRRAATPAAWSGPGRPASPRPATADRKSTRLNSSHVAISYAVFCLKKKKTKYQTNRAKKTDHQHKTIACTDCDHVIE